MKDEHTRAAEARKGTPFLTTREAAHYLCLSYRTLEKMRLTSNGPRFRKHVRYVRYHIADLDAWSEGRQKNSTSDAEEGA